MGRVAITAEERFAAYAAAIDMAKGLLSEEANHVHPMSKIGELSPWEWDKLASALVSGWIIERSRQITAERFWLDESFLTTGEDIEPSELGPCAAILPALGSFVESEGLSDVALGSWPKLKVVKFIALAVSLVERAKVTRDERPGPVEAPQTMYSG
jgi:hypothetical protein